MCSAGWGGGGEGASGNSKGGKKEGAHDGSWLHEDCKKTVCRVRDSNTLLTHSTLNVHAQGHSKVVWSVAVSKSSGLVVTGSGDCTVKVWDLASGQCTQTLKVRSAEYAAWQGQRLFYIASRAEASGQCTQTLKVRGAEHAAWQGQRLLYIASRQRRQGGARRRSRRGPLRSTAGAEG